MIEFDTASTMLNLTANPITLLAASGETTTIEPSGFVARVETVRQYHSAYYFAAIANDAPCVRVIEETPRAIMIEDAKGVAFRLTTMENFTTETSCIAVGEDKIILVTRQVAQAARHFRHPLASRMVWPIEPVYYEDAYGPQIVRGYKALQRCPQ